MGHLSHPYSGVNRSYRWCGCLSGSLSRVGAHRPPTGWRVEGFGTSAAHTDQTFPSRSADDKIAPLRSRPFSSGCHYRLFREAWMAYMAIKGVSPKTTLQVPITGARVCSTKMSPIVPFS
jgi:hypothetical protein